MGEAGRDKPAGLARDKPRTIISNTGNVLTVKGAWDVDPDNTYVVTQEYQEDETTPADLSSLEKLQGSYSTIVGDNGVERIFRVRETANNESLRKAWFMLLP